MTTTIQKHDDVYCVAYADSLYSEPIFVTHYWPIGEPAQSALCDDYIGAQAWDAGLGAYYAKQRDAKPFCGVSIYCPLRDGGQTQPIHTTKKTLPAPKTRCKTKYWHGCWYKFLKAKGWVAA
jgi:hypothetical protein